MAKSPDLAMVERVVADQHDRPLPKVVRREIRLPEVPGNANALVGMRRSGKTYCLFAEIQALLARGVPRSRIFYLNLEDDRLSGADLATLDQALETFYRRDPAARGEGAWIMLDEVQAVSGWERFARRILDTERARLFVTGSSARQLSTEVATAFRGRSTTVEVLPYSLREAATASGISLPTTWPPGAARRSQLDAFVLDYLQQGGFPAVRAATPHDRIQVLQEYVDLVVLRDVGERHSATNLPALRQLVAALFAANANGFSVSRLQGSLQSQGLPSSKATLLAYLEHLVDAYLCFLVPLRTRSARQRAVNPRKVYAVDPGLAAAMYRAGAVNLGAQLENAVYLELRRRHGRLADSVVTWFKTNTGNEVDFAVDDPVRGGPPELIQACMHLDTDSTLQREVAGLGEAMAETGAHSGTIVTLSTAREIEVAAGKIQVVPAREWFFRRS